MTQQATGSQPSRMVTVAEVCEQLGIGKTKFYALINAGELAAVDVSPNKPKAPRRVGETGHRRALRVEQAEIDRFKKERAVTA